MDHRPAMYEQRSEQIGRQLLAHARQASSSVWSDRLMDWAMRDPAFKSQLFRFVDVFPTLSSAQQVHRHLSEYLRQPGVTLPAGMDAGLRAGALVKGAVSQIVARQIRAMANRFIADNDAGHMARTLRQLWDRHIAFSVDQLGEACVSRAEAQIYQQQYLTLIEQLAQHAADWPTDPLLEQDHLGVVPRVNVSIKISSLTARINPAAPGRTMAELFETIEPILQLAARHGVLVNFDMEQYALKDLTLDLFERCCEAIDFPAGLALQAYLRTGQADAQRLIDWTRRTGRVVTVRLVKGAYWDYEVIHADQMRWPVPVWTTKAQTDACFERMTQQLIAAIPHQPGRGGVRLALGSHNARSMAAGMAMIEQSGLPMSALEIQMLRGMAEPLKQAAVAWPLRVREYVPVGQMIPGMAYLVRRLLENTSNESWLRAGFHEAVPDQVLLASPHPQAHTEQAEERHSPQDAAAMWASRHQLSPAAAGVGNEQPFVTEPVRDFADAQQRDAFARAVRTADVPAVANDATVEQAQQAVKRAAGAFAAWRDTDPHHRAGLLIQLARSLRDRRDELAGIIIRESAKPWAEADGDVCEAIDFCEYYARGAIGLFKPQRLGRFGAELNLQWHQPRGVAVVISPWNFPLAICTGMTVAALVTGNTVIVKPAEQSPGIASILCKLLWQAGVPRDVLHFLPGQGETVGAALVRDPRVAVVAFTGSKAVGLDIFQAAGMTPPAQRHVKKVVCEMGGKNAIIIDSSADLDEAVVAVWQSAFGYAGQKCSAASRVIVLDDVHDLFLDRLVEASRALVVGDPLDPATDVGPVIDAEAYEKITGYIRIGKQEGQLVLGSDRTGHVRGKPLVWPHIFKGIEPGHRLAQEEIFGPVLSVMRAGSFDTAIEIANASPYRLTGGVFSRTPSHLQLAWQQFRVGNLYLNRSITGALVARQPFGGFGLSGAGTKAGGNEYLLQFVEPRVSTENMMRRGFSPQW